MPRNPAIVFHHSIVAEMKMLAALVALIAPLAALTAPRDGPGENVTALRAEMRGLNRLKNSTIAGRAIFPSGGIRGVNVGACNYGMRTTTDLRSKERGSSSSPTWLETDAGTTW